MSKQPWLKFYPADWRGDLTLAPCSLAARGLWMELLCIMSDATPRGSLVRDGEPYTLKQIAAVARAPIREVERLIGELQSEGVFSKDESGAIFSRRMRRDIEKEERDKAYGKQGGNPRLKPKPNGGVNPPNKAKDNGEDKAQNPESRSQKPDTKSLRDFGASDAICDRFFAAYPKRAEEADTRRELGRWLSDGVVFEEIEAGAKRYAVECRGRGPEHVSSPVRWLRGERWNDGKPKPEVELAAADRRVRVLRDSPEGRAWDEHKIAATGKPAKWVDNYVAGYFPTEWPPGHEQRDAAE